MKFYVNTKSPRHLRDHMQYLSLKVYLYTLLAEQNRLAPRNEIKTFFSFDKKTS